MGKKKLGVSRRAFARLDGCSETAVRQGIAEGRLQLLADGTLDPALAGSGWRRGNVRGGVQEGESPAQAAQRLTAETPELMTLGESERQKQHYLAELRRLEFEAKAGQYLPADEVLREWSSMVLRARSILLFIPRKVAVEAASLTSPAAVEALIQREVYEALDELAREEEGDDER